MAFSKCEALTHPEGHPMPIKPAFLTLSRFCKGGLGALCLGRQVAVKRVFKVGAKAGPHGLSLVGSPNVLRQHPEGFHAVGNTLLRTGFAWPPELGPLDVHSGRALA